MIKLVVCMKRLPHLSQAEFLRFWLEEHGPIVRKNAVARRIKRYTQVHPDGATALAGIVERRGGSVVKFDGMAEICWDSVDDIIAASKTAEGQRAAAEIVEHEKQFLDLPNLEFFLGKEHVFLSELTKA
jgi:uncharacterized protein (TIGR02118 family)